MVERIIAWFIGLFKEECPHCKKETKIKIDFYDMEYDRMVYKCSHCGKKLI
jgi:predicted Zn finger-like uncharacterized protein